MGYDLAMFNQLTITFLYVTDFEGCKIRQQWLSRSGLFDNLWYICLLTQTERESECGVCMCDRQTEMIIIERECESITTEIHV